MIQVVFFLSNSVIYQHRRLDLVCFFSKEVIVADDLSVSFLLQTTPTSCCHSICSVVLLLEQELLLLLKLQLMVVLCHDSGLTRNALALTVKLGRIVIVDVLTLGGLGLIVALFAIFHFSILAIGTIVAHEAARAVVSKSGLVTIVTSVTTASVVEVASTATASLITITATVVAASATSTVAASLAATIFVIAVVEVSRRLTAQSTATHRIITTGRREGGLGVEQLLCILRLLELIEEVLTGLLLEVAVILAHQSI